MAVAVGSGEERGVTGRGPRIRVVVIAVSEVGATIGEQAEAVGTKLIVRAIEIVATKLVDDDDDDELGLRVVSGSGNEECRRGERSAGALQGEVSLV